MIHRIRKLSYWFWISVKEICLRGLVSIWVLDLDLIGMALNLIMISQAIVKYQYTRMVKRSEISFLRVLFRNQWNFPLVISHIVIWMLKVQELHCVSWSFQFHAMGSFCQPQWNYVGFKTRKTEELKTNLELVSESSHKTRFVFPIATYSSVIPGYSSKHLHGRSLHF